MSPGDARVAVAARDGSLVIAVARFCRLLRRSGVRVAAGATSTALAALREIDIARRADFRAALRASLLQRPEDFQPFNYLFNAYWSTGESGPAPQSIGPGAELGPGAEIGDDAIDDESEACAVVDGLPAAAADEARAGTRDGRPCNATAAGVSPAAAIRGDAVSEPDLGRVAHALSQALATRPGRRLAPHPHGPVLDLRGSLRRSLRHGGVPVRLHWRRPKPARSRLLVFCDVSRSMSGYTALFLRFAAAVLRRGWRTEIFLFASDLMRVTEPWRDRDWTELEAAISACGGGTRIGHCLDGFLRDYGTSPGGDGYAIVLSDGLDAGEPAALDGALRRLKARIRALVWLNPLLRLEGYEPSARGMATALPYVDLFAPAHDLDSLWRLIDALRARRRGRPLRAGPA